MRKKRAWEAIAIRASQPHARQSDCRDSTDGVKTYGGGGGDGDGGSDVGGVESVVGDDIFGNEDDEEEDDDDDEEVLVSQDASEIIEGLIRNGFGRRETKTCFGVVPGMIQGTEVSNKLGNREFATERCGDQGGELGCW